MLAKFELPAPQQQAIFCTGKGYKAGCTITSYYYFAGQRVAMRVQSDANATGVVTWLHGDHLGSVSVETDAGSNKIANSDSRYLPFGEQRSGFTGSGLPTDRRFTGQISVAGGLIDMNARALDPLLGRFISADTIVPSPADPQSLNRYSYALNNPLRYVDSNGHCPTPPSSMGATICLALFIKPSAINVAGTLTVHGDGRSFDDASSPDASRGYLWISTTDGKWESHMNPTGYLGLPVAESLCKVAGCKVDSSGIAWFEPSKENKWEVTRNEQGDITVQYDLVLSGILEGSAPHINGSIIFHKDHQGRYKVNGERDGFPWAEAYYHDGKGNTSTIFRRSAIRGTPNDLRAIEETSGRNLSYYFGELLAPPPYQLDSICTPNLPC